MKELAIGETAQLEAAIYPDFATKQPVAWSSSNDGIISVDSMGTVTANSSGNAVITAQAGSVSATIEIRSYRPAVSIECDLQELTMRVGETHPANVHISEGADHLVTWQSSNISVAVVDPDGDIVAVGSGSAMLTASIDGLTCEIFVEVKEERLEVSLYQSDAEEMQLKVDIKNNSCMERLNCFAFLALYCNTKNIAVKEIKIDLQPGEEDTLYFPLTFRQENATYTAKLFSLNEEFAPVQKAEIIGLIT